MPQRFLLLLPAFLLCCSFSKPVEANPIFIPISSRALIEPYSEDDFMGDIAPLQPQKIHFLIRSPEGNVLPARHRIRPVVENTAVKRNSLMDNLVGIGYA